jgi:hypothetical protein
MPRRSKIGNQLIDAWTQTVEKDYCSGHVNSERSLQALLLANLMVIFEDSETNRRVFVEPTVKLSNGSVIRPDMMICNARDVICVLELKYVPRGIADRTKDMRSISAIAKASKLSVALERYRGSELPQLSFEVSKTVLFAWAGIHCGDTKPTPQWHDRAFAAHYFLELHATTTEGMVPRLRYNTNALRITIDELMEA